MFVAVISLIVLYFSVVQLCPTTVRCDYSRYCVQQTDKRNTSLSQDWAYKYKVLTAHLTNQYLLWETSECLTVHSTLCHRVTQVCTIANIFEKPTSHKLANHMTSTSAPTIRLLIRFDVNAAREQIRLCVLHFAIRPNSA